MKITTGVTESDSGAIIKEGLAMGTTRIRGTEAGPGPTTEGGTATVPDRATTREIGMVPDETIRRGMATGREGMMTGGAGREKAAGGETGVGRGWRGSTNCPP